MHLKSGLDSNSCTRQPDLDLCQQFYLIWIFFLATTFPVFKNKNLNKIKSSVSLFLGVKSSAYVNERSTMLLIYSAGKITKSMWGT